MNEVLCSNGPSMLGNDYCNIESNMNLNLQISAVERKSCYGHKMSEYRVQTESVGQKPHGRKPHGQKPQRIKAPADKSPSGQTPC